MKLFRTKTMTRFVPPSVSKSASLPVAPTIKKSDEV